MSASVNRGWKKSIIKMPSHRDEDQANTGTVQAHRTDNNGTFERCQYRVMLPSWPKLMKHWGLKNWHGLYRLGSGMLHRHPLCDGRDVQSNIEVSRLREKTHPLCKHCSVQREEQGTAGWLRHQNKKCLGIRII